MPPVQSQQPNLQPIGAFGPSGPVSQQVQVPVAQGKDTTGLIKTIVIIIVSLVAVTFIGLFIWMFLQYKSVDDDVQGRIDVAVAAAKDEQAQKDEAEFSEREKYPLKTFSGPADYGQLTFEYPKTWSVYVAADASNGGDFSAYFNPAQVDTVSNSTINALRVTILDRNFEDVTSEYQKYVEKEDSGLTVESITVFDTAANRYVGKIPNTDLNGIIVIFKIRDKTAVLRTDSLLFTEDFDSLIDTVTFNA